MKINKHLLTLLFSIFLLNCAFNQNLSFSKVISPYGNNSYASFAANGIVKQNNNYILALIGFDTTNISTDIQSLFFAKIDSNGQNFEIIKKYNQPDTNYLLGYGPFIRIHDGGFCLVGEFDSNYNQKVQHFIMLFDSNMNNILTKIIPHDTIWETIRTVKETNDHGFIITGGRYITDIENGVLIIKTDSMGNQIWKKTLQPGENSIGTQIEETPDHGFLICGYKDSYIQGGGGPILLKTDSAGNFIWMEYLGNIGQHDGTAAFAITNQGDYIVALGFANYTYTGNIAWAGRLNVIKYTQDGNEIWNRMYDTIRQSVNVNNILIYPNNDFTIIGNYAQPTKNDSDYSFFPSFMYKFNANGDSLWRRIYYYTKNYVDGNILVDNMLNSDGSITACGYVDGDTLSPYQQVWILKTDSNGYAPGCEPTGIEEIQYTKQEEIRVYPNPSKDNLTIETNINTEQRIEIINLFGQTVYTTYINKKATINTSAFAKGVYILKLSSDKETVVRKFVKE